jgi:hypothetical protein
VGLESFERKVAVLVESIFSKGSPRGVEPAELGRALVREIEREARIGVRSSIAPNVLVVALAPEDATELAPLRNRVQGELRELADETIEAGGYQLLGPISLRIVEDAKLRSGTFYIDCTFAEEAGFNDRFEIVLASGARHRLGTGKHVIGRLAGCAIVLDDSRVSRRHAELVIENGGIEISDLGSTNGTFVNGVRITGPVELGPDDVVTIGITEFTVRKG